MTEENLNKYSRGKIYKIVSNQTDKIYIGSTIEKNLNNRFWDHKSQFRRFKNGKGNYVTSFDILEYGDAKVILLENYPCENKNDLHLRERYHIDSNDCVNKAIPGRGHKESLKAYHTKNKKVISEYQKEYRKVNKDVISARKKAYYQTNLVKRLQSLPISDRIVAYEKQIIREKKYADRLQEEYLALIN